LARSIDVVFIACYRRDYRLTRALVANLRHWYPGTPIALLKDDNMLSFDTSDLERMYGVTVYPCRDKVFGMGFSKLEPLFDAGAGRALFLDSDTLLAGPVLDSLQRYDEDFVVVEEADTAFNRNSYYFDRADVEAFDPAFRYPGFTFNTGQFVATCGVLRRSDFDGLVDWSQPRRILRRDVFRYHGEQPVLNYVVLKKLAEGRLSVRRADFMREGGHADVAGVSIGRILSRQGYPFLIHWHDAKPKVNLPSMRHIARNDLIRCFEGMYYRKAGVTRTGRYLRLWLRYLADEIFLLSLRVYERVFRRR